MKCAYCRGEHPTMDELQGCAARTIAWEANEQRRDRQEMEWVEAELNRQAYELAHPSPDNEPPAEDVYGADDGEFFREAMRETYDL